MTWPSGYKAFFVLKLTELKSTVHEIYAAHVMYMLKKQTIVGILTFMSMINDWV